MKQLMNKKLKKRADGFSIVETLVSLALMTMAILFLMKIAVYSFHVNMQSLLRLELSQELDSYKDLLLSRPFTAGELALGQAVVNGEAGHFNIAREITEVTPSLKKISLSITHKSFTKKISFYKSKYIKEVESD